MLADFSGRAVLVTGAAGNLGRAVGAAFHAAGAQVLLLDQNRAALAAAWPDNPPRQTLIVADLMDPASTAAATGQILQTVPRIDVLCNVAGGFCMGPKVHETPPDLWNLMLDLNAGTLLNAVRAVVPGMLTAGSGKIINIGAGAGLTGRGQMGAYSAAKSAVIRLTESMAAELREHGINVNCVLPSIIDTPQNRADMPQADPSRWVAPAALAEVILFLASDAARAIHGAAIPVSGLS